MYTKVILKLYWKIKDCLLVKPNVEFLKNSSLGTSITFKYKIFFLHSYFSELLLLRNINGLLLDYFSVIFKYFKITCTSSPEHSQRFKCNYIEVITDQLCFKKIHKIHIPCTYPISHVYPRKLTEKNKIKTKTNKNMHTNFHTYLHSTLSHKAYQ